MIHERLVRIYLTVQSSVMLCCLQCSERCSECDRRRAASDSRVHSRTHMTQRKQTHRRPLLLPPVCDPHGCSLACSLGCAETGRSSELTLSLPWCVCRWYWKTVWRCTGVATDGRMSCRGFRQWGSAVGAGWSVEPSVSGVVGFGGAAAATAGAAHISAAGASVFANDGMLPPTPVPVPVAPVGLRQSFTCLRIP